MRRLLDQVRILTTFRLNIDAVAFDLDGTLLETGPDLAHAANAMLGDLGFAPQPQPVLMTFIGHGIANLVRRALLASAGSEPSAALIERASELFRSHYRAHLCVETRAYPSVVRTLERLGARGLRLACITNKSFEFAQPLLAQTNLAQHLELVLGGDSLAARKPDPLPLTHVAAQFGTRPSRLLMVGDSKVDVQAARAAGAPVFVVSYGYSGGVPARELGADAVIDELAEIEGFL